MHRILALIERDLRKLLGSPTLIVVSMVFPLVQLVVLGSAFASHLARNSMSPAVTVALRSPRAIFQRSLRERVPFSACMRLI